MWRHIFSLYIWLDYFSNLFSSNAYNRPREFGCTLLCSLLLKRNLYAGCNYSESLTLVYSRHNLSFISTFDKEETIPCSPLFEPVITKYFTSDYMQLYCILFAIVFCNFNLISNRLMALLPMWVTHLQNICTAPISRKTGYLHTLRSMSSAKTVHKVLFNCSNVRTQVLFRPIIPL